MLLGSIIYVQVTLDGLRAELLPTGSSTSIDCEALAHPRTLMGDFSAIESAYKQAFEALGQKAWYKPKPVVLTHLVPKVDGGYTNVELRAFREAALGAGASQSYILADHPPLSATEKQDVSKFFK